MLKSLLRLLPTSTRSDAGIGDGVFHPASPRLIDAPGVTSFDFAGSLVAENDLPIPDWRSLTEWITKIPDAQEQAKAWANAELAWLAHLQAALGPQYHLARREGALLLSTLEPHVATATVHFMTKTLARIGNVLEGIAYSPEWGHDILLVFDSEDAYYRYVSRYYPEDGEFSFSSGMHISFGCSHFATFKAELRAIEPVIAHEMTHGCLAHLPIPAWLNEGLAVNTERRLCPPSVQQYTPQQLHWMHQHFWTHSRIQQFWSGESFHRPDEGSLLSYELAHIMVEQLSSDWASFAAFANEADRDDAGAQAARKHLEVDLGAAVTAFFEFEPSDEWAPNPGAWQSPAERGAPPGPQPHDRVFNTSLAH